MTWPQRAEPSRGQGWTACQPGQIAEAQGVRAIRVTTPAQLPDVVAEIVAIQDRPVLISVALDQPP